MTLVELLALPREHRNAILVQDLASLTIEARARIDAFGIDAEIQHRAAAYSELMTVRAVTGLFGIGIASAVDQRISILTKAAA